MNKTTATVQLQDSENLLPQQTVRNGGKIVAKSDEVDSEDPSETTDYRCDQLSYGIGDAVFGMFIVAPLVVGMWRSTWGIMEINRTMFPCAQVYTLGIIIHTSFALLRSYLLSRSTAASNEHGAKFLWFRERVLSRIYTYIFALSCIMHWSGGWGLFDAFVAIIVPKESDPHRAVLIGTITAVFYVSIAILKSARNILAPPYFIVTDGKEATYQFTTRFRKRFEKNVADNPNEEMLWRRHNVKPLHYPKFIVPGPHIWNRDSLLYIVADDQRISLKECMSMHGVITTFIGTPVNVSR